MAFAVYAVGDDKVSDDLIEYCKKSENEYDLACLDIITENKTDVATNVSTGSRKTPNSGPDSNDPTSPESPEKTGDEKSLPRSVISLAV